MHNIYFLYILLLSAVLLSSCREDEVVVPTEYDILPVTIIRKTKCSGISEQNVPFPKRNVPL